MLPLKSALQNVVRKHAMILLIDNYDSFTYNLVHYLYELGAKVKVVRNDEMTADEALALPGVDRILLSPGPCTPNEAGICLEIVEKAAGKLPILGVCLGHQTIAQSFGGKVVRATPVHGKIARISHDCSAIFSGLRSPFNATRYHSLVVEKESLPDCFEITATGGDEDVIMAISHKELPIYGVQFHPESIASEQGHALLKNFMEV